jgi:LuxR family maltose regulon positive regulatory protein
MRADIALNRDDLAHTIALAHQALANLAPDDLRIRADVMLFLGVAYQWRTQYQRAVEVYAAASQLATRAGHVLIAVYAPVCQAQVLHGQGLFHQAAAALRQAGNYAAEHGVEQLPLMANYHVTLAELLYEWNDLESADLHLKEGIHQAQRGQNPRTLVRAYAKQLRLLIAQRAADEAHATAEQIQRLLREHPFPNAILVEVTLPLVHKWLGEGNLAAVTDWITQRNLQMDNPVIEGKEQQYTMLARLLAARGEYRPALRLLERIVKSAEKLGKTTCVVEALAFTSVVLHLADDHAGALHVLARSLTLAQPEGYIRTFVDAGEPVRLRILDCTAVPHGTKQKISCLWGQAVGRF